MNPLFQVLKYLLAGAAGIAAFSFGAQWLTANVLLDRPAMEAYAQYDKMQQDAIKEYPNDGPLLALAKYAHKQGQEKLEGAASRKEREVIAASIFMGFWLANGRARAEVCADNGVDLSGFVATFHDHNLELYKRSIRILEGEAEEERLYEINRDAMMSHVSYEMLYMHDGIPMSLHDSCKKLVDQAFVFIPKLNFENAEPGIANTILAARPTTG